MPYFGLRAPTSGALRFALIGSLLITGNARVIAADMAPVCPVINAVQFCDVEDVTPPTGVRQLVYSSEYHVLVLKNASSAAATIDLTTHETTFHFSSSYFTDMSISPSRRFVFAADYGGENIGYGTPRYTSYVHRLDLADLSWGVPESVYIAGNVAAVADDQFILKSDDQWITFTNNRWSGEGAAIVLNSATGGWAPAYYAGVYEGDFRYVPVSRRLIHGNTGSSSEEIQAFHLSVDDFSKQEEAYADGGQAWGAKVTLASDYSGFYYGTLKVDPLDVTHSLQTFPEAIYAASGSIAFGENNYYDAESAQILGSLGFSAEVYALDSSGTDFWVFDSSEDLLRHFVRDDRLFSGSFD